MSGDLRPSASTASTSTSPTLISLVLFAPGEYHRELLVIYISQRSLWLIHYQP